MFKNLKINLEFGDYIWNHHEKCIQILSTNMPDIGLEIYIGLDVTLAYMYAPS